MTLVPLLKRNVCKGYTSQIKNADMIYVIKLLDITLRVIIDKSHVQEVKKTYYLHVLNPKTNPHVKMCILMRLWCIVDYMYAFTTFSIKHVAKSLDETYRYHRGFIFLTKQKRG